jgi:phenylpyruvate tautomerase PptA (4-oxalocrotonate tautomerase family)
MPLIQVRAMEGFWTEPRRKALMARITDAVADIGGEGLRTSTWVLWDDIQSGKLTVGGEPATSASVDALARGPSRSSK